MKKILSTFSLLFCCFVLIAQNNLNLKSGKFLLNTDLQIDNLNQVNYLFIYFDKILTDNEKLQLEFEGVNFLEYIPKNTKTSFSAPKTAL